MASFVDICNISLSHLGDSATVASIDPPEGSAQAEHCARFLPLALATILEIHPWSFATRREALAEVSNPSSTWAYAYAMPSGVVNTLAILDAAAPDDYSSNTHTSESESYLGRNPTGGAYTPQAYVCETDVNGTPILLTNQVNAVLRYSRIISDPTQFSPLFTNALTWLLSSMLAGPVLKGDAGLKGAQAAMQSYDYWLKKATDSDASQRRVVPRQQVGWINAR